MIIKKSSPLFPSNQTKQSNLLFSPSIPSPPSPPIEPNRPLLLSSNYFKYLSCPKDFPLTYLDVLKNLNFAASGKENRLQQIRDSMISLERSKLREDIVARRQKKLGLRHARQKFLEEAASREAELLQELDRERTTEMEKELERQRLLELERAKTRELRHNLDMEKERQMQRELQRELEQAESGQRTSRRDYSSTHSSRPRERFRERENGRSSNEASTRGGSGNLQPEVPTTTSSSMAASPTIVLSGSRQFSGQLPTILQSRDRQDDSSSLYEENLDGSKDSGDTGSIGDPELVSAFDGQSSGYGSQRHSSRGSKSRQIGERRERDNRREGKWERKHL